MSASISWDDYWSIVKSAPDERTKQVWGSAIAPTLDDLDRWMKSRSIRVVEEVLSTAPVEFVCLFLHLLPRDRARVVLANFSLAEQTQLTRAYTNPPKMLK